MQLIALGVGSIIGTGIFVMTGTAASQNAGPALVLSMILTTIGCAFSGLCYAEFAAMVPIAGSAYTYAYATIGEFIAWIIGWDLILEYALSVSTVAVGWSGYFVSLANDIGIHIPVALTTPLGKVVTDQSGATVTGVVQSAGDLHRADRVDAPHQRDQAVGEREHGDGVHQVDGARRIRRGGRGVREARRT